MRVLVYPHDLSIGGSQLNAIELADAVGRLGHEIVVYGQPGPLADRIDALGLELIASPPARRRPTSDIVRHLGRVIDERGIDIAHGYEWPPGLECYLACRGRAGARAVTTVMSMAVAPFLPASMPLSVGTEQIAAHERERGRQQVSVIEPPVDIVANRPGDAIAAARFREELELRADQPVVVAVSRLARELKLEGLLTAIDAVASLHPGRPTQLLLVGDGNARGQVAERADRANRALGYRAIVLTGELADPRPAYDVADVCIAMGGSALRSMAFAKPLVVQGEGGFFELLDPATLPEFLWTGWYGYGTHDRRSDPATRLRDLLHTLLADHDRRASLGRFGRAVVEQRFSLDSAARRQVQVYEDALEIGPAGTNGMIDELTASARFARYQLSRRAERLRGLRAADDFNARPVARQTRSDTAPIASSS